MEYNYLAELQDVSFNLVFYRIMIVFSTIPLAMTLRYAIIERRDIPGKLIFGVFVPLLIAEMMNLMFELSNH